MGILDYDHPSILDFVTSKIENVLKNFNISVLVKDDFFDKLKKGEKIKLKFDNETYGEIKADDLFSMIATCAWKNGDPGLIFFDRANRDNPYYPKVILDGTNPSLRKGTKVLTDSGIYSIEELENKRFKVFTLSNRYAEAQCFLSGKNKPLYEIILTGNHKIYATKEHHWLVYNNGEIIKKKTIELKRGDFLPIVFHNNLNYGYLGTYEEGLLIGWNFGDGSITIRKDNNKRQYGFYFYSEKEKCRNKILNIIKKITLKKYKNNLKEYHISSKKLDDLFIKFKAIDKKDGIPSSIWKEASEEFRKGFIDGLFSTNACVTKEGITLTSSIKKLRDEICELLGFYGIKTRKKDSVSTSKFSNKKKYKKNYYRYGLIIDKTASIRFRKIFKLTNDDKQKKLLNIKTSKTILQNKVRVQSINLTSLKENVWDIRVNDITHSFQLPYCVTGNCGEVPLMDNGICCLGSINLSKFVKKDSFNFRSFKQYIELGTRTLLNMNGLAWMPTTELQSSIKKYNFIGLGFMGFADALIKLGIYYDSEEALKFIDEIAKPYVEITNKLAKRSFYKRIIAPTGSLSILANCSSGIEPPYARNIERHLSIGKIKEGRENLYQSKYCKTALEISPEWHLKIQAQFQKYCDGAISKTINLPNSATIEDIKKIYLMAYELDLKGITIFRDGCRGDNQVLKKMPITKCNGESCHL